MADSPYALTDSHVAALEKAVRAEGYDIQYDTDTGEFSLTRPARDWSLSEFVTLVNEKTDPAIRLSNGELQAVIAEMLSRGYSLSSDKTVLFNVSASLFSRARLDRYPRLKWRSVVEGMSEREKRRICRANSWRFLRAAVGWKDAARIWANDRAWRKGAAG